MLDSRAAGRNANDCIRMWGHRKDEGQHVGWGSTPDRPGVILIQEKASDGFVQTLVEFGGECGEEKLRSVEHTNLYLLMEMEPRHLQKSLSFQQVPEHKQHSGKKREELKKRS